MEAPQKMELPKVVAVVGCGSIGASWAALFAHHGLRVQVYDPSAAAEQKLLTLLHEASIAFAVLASSDKPPTSTSTSTSTTTPPPSKQLPPNVTFTTNLPSALENATFVQESCPEDIQLKSSLYKTLEANLPAHAPILSSTSGLTATTLSQPLTHPSRFAIGHPFNPPHLIPLVEVVGGKDTSPATLELAMRFYQSLGKRPVHVRREVPGHVANRLQAALFREILYLVENDVASVADIEAAMVHGPGLRWGVMGPSSLFHLGGGQLGGAEHFSSHILRPMLGWCAEETPVLGDELRAKWVRQTGEAVGESGLDYEGLCRRRDEGVLEILRWRAANAMD